MILYKKKTVFLHEKSRKCKIKLFYTRVQNFLEKLGIFRYVHVQ